MEWDVIGDTPFDHILTNTENAVVAAITAVYQSAFSGFDRLGPEGQ